MAKNDCHYDSVLKTINKSPYLKKILNIEIQRHNSRIPDRKPTSKPERTPYEVLGVNRDATANEIKQAYRALARTKHPDKVQGDKNKKVAEEKFTEIKDCYELLSDPIRKQKWDRAYPQDEHSMNNNVRSGPR